MKRTLLTALILALAAGAQALEIDQVLYDRAFSPNGDGVQDECHISFVAQSDGDPLTLLRVLIASSPAVPPDEGDILEMPVEVADTGSALYSLHGSWDGLDDAEEPYSDGFYFMHIHVATASEELWMDTAVELELNTVPPDFVSTALEPSPWFTPLMEEADTLQQVFFTSESFDTLTDQATLTLYRWQEASGTYEEIKLLERDPDYVLDTGTGLRYRFLWNGKDDVNQIVDGLYRGWIRLQDDAGNRAESMISLDLDASAPIISVLGLGGWTEGEVNFDFHPDLLPDTLYLRCEDRHQVDSCRVAWGTDLEFDTWGDLLESGDGYAEWVFLLPGDWGRDSTYTVRVDALDGAGQWNAALDEVESISVGLDSVDPDAPVWLTSSGPRIQSYLELSGSTGEGDLEVFLFRDGEPVDTTDVGGTHLLGFSVILEEGEQVFTLQARDPAGNLSPLSEELAITYRPGAALRIPGRLRGHDDETLQVNTPRDASSVDIRVFSLDGSLVRRMEALGGPREWVLDWDLRDGEGGRLMGGLYLLLVTSTLEDGEVLRDRKVVALVQP